MIARLELENLCNERLDDAKALFQSGRYEGAFYMCGYAIEFALKKRICLTLGWQEYPPDNKNELRPFKTHHLELLLTLSGIESHIRNTLFSEWSFVAKWDVEFRYSSTRQTKQDVEYMIVAAEKLLKSV